MDRHYKCGSLVKSMFVRKFSTKSLLWSCKILHLKTTAAHDEFNGPHSDQTAQLCPPPIHQR